METSRSLRRRNPSSGAALVELAVTLPLIVLVFIGTVDFGRVFYTAITLTDAARAGALYGAVVNDGDTGPTGKIVATAKQAANNLDPSTVDVTASRSCVCANDLGTSFTATTPVNTCGSGACPTAGTHVVVSVTVTARKTFTTIGNFPGIPSTMRIERAATMRKAN